LDPELAHPVCIFYLVLRGLDTIEDDMTIDRVQKIKMLRTFWSVIGIDGWHFDGCGEMEKDRVLLERFDVVVEQFNLLKEEYQNVIVDITRRMGNGMADFVDGKKVYRNRRILL
jgi:farnesyl-diphosphate farnesyltransferase